MKSPLDVIIGNGRRLVIFDCDGVLIESWDSTMAFYNRILAGLGLGPMTPEDETYVFASSIPEGLARLVPPDLRPAAEGILKTVKVEDFLSLIRIKPGVPEFLDHLRKSGRKTAVCTNGGAEARPILEALGLLWYFEIVVTAADVERPKPHPEGVLRILETVGAAPREAVYIGDSEQDRLAAQAAGVDFIAYGAPRLAADVHLDDFGSLLESSSAPRPLSKNCRR